MELYICAYTDQTQTLFTTMGTVVMGTIENEHFAQTYCSSQHVWHDTLFTLIVAEFLFHRIQSAPKGLHTPTNNGNLYPNRRTRTMHTPQARNQGNILRLHVSPQS